MIRTTSVSNLAGREPDTHDLNAACQKIIDTGATILGINLTVAPTGSSSAGAWDSMAGSQWFTWFITANYPEATP